MDRDTSGQDLTRARGVSSRAADPARASSLSVHRTVESGQAPERPLRILIDAINDNAEPRGPDRYLERLLTQMRAHGPQHRYVVVYASWQRLFREMAPAADLQPVELAPPRRPLARALWHAGRFPAIARELEPDVVFLPNIIWTPGLVPTVMTVHDLAHFRFPEKFGRIKGRLQRPLIRRAIRSANKLISVSEATTADIRRFAPAGTGMITQIPEGGPEAIMREGSEQGGRFFLYVGKLERTKNVEALIRAFLSSDALAEEGWQVVIAGPDGNAADEIRALAAASCGRVRLAGFVGEDELRRLYLDAGVFVFPSRIEGFGLVLLEAMAHGAPVIGMNASAIPEVVGDAGLLVDVDKPDGLVCAMERLAADPALRQRLREAGYRRLEQFSWRAAAESTLSLLAETAESAR